MIISAIVLIIMMTRSKKTRNNLEGLEVVSFAILCVGAILFATLLPMMLISIKTDRVNIKVLEKQIALNQMNNDGKVKVELNGQTLTVDADKVLDLHQYRKLKLKLKRLKNIGDIEKTKIHVLVWFGISL